MLDDEMNKIKSVEKILNEIAGAELIKEKLTEARRTLKKDDADINKINTLLFIKVLTINLFLFLYYNYFDSVLTFQHYHLAIFLKRYQLNVQFLI